MIDSQYTIDTTGLKRFVAESRNTYKSLFELLRTKTKSIGPELTDLVDNYCSLFAAISKGVEKISSHEPCIEKTSNKNDILVAYSLNIAAITVTKDLESMIDEGAVRMNIRDTAEIEPDKVFEWRKTNYSNTKNALESMVKYVMDSSKSHVDALKDFFEEYSLILNQNIISKTDKNDYQDLSKIKWEIGTYKISGLNQIKLDNDNKQSITTNDDNKFHTPLQPLIIPENEILPKDRIIGDRSIIDKLEQMITLLFCYNPKTGMNPYLDDDKMYKSACMLEGMPGGGKGAVCYNTINYAQKLNQALPSNLFVTEFVVDSSWVDGSILKLKSQFKQIIDDNKIYLIFQDEIERLIKSNKGGSDSSHNKDVQYELQKFLEGAYKNKGNYLLLATTNKFNSLPLAIRNRFELYSWEGAQTAEEKADLYKFKLEKGIERGYVEVNDSDLKRLGQLAYEEELSGRNITRICMSAKQNNYNYDGIVNVIRLRDQSYEQQIKEKNKLFGKITFETLEYETMIAIDNLKKAKQNTIRYEND
jgi:hypothetical protein